MSEHIHEFKEFPKGTLQEHFPDTNTIPAYHDNGATSEERAAVEAHFEVCESCAEEYNQMVEMLARIEDLQRRQH